MKVFILDDEPKIRRGLAHVVSTYRPDWPEPSTAGNCTEALNEPTFWESDLLLLDIQMPNMSGLELLQKLRTSHRDDMLVAIISGYAEFTFAQQAIQLGVSDYLLKPISLERVYKLLNAMEKKLPAKPSAPSTADGAPALSGKSGVLLGSPITSSPFSDDKTLYIGSFLRRIGSFSVSVEKAIVYIIANYNMELDLATISEHVHLHKNYLSTIFKQETGVNMNSFIIDYRIYTAKQLLRQSNAKIATVARAVGFSDDHYFNQVFSKRVGTSPQKYRAQISCT